MKNKIYDLIVVGTGIYGINITRLLSKKYPEMKIALLDSNKNFYLNNSINNSGVLHSGVYYQQNSIKAKFCSLGQRELTEFCDENKFPIRKCGKVIVGTKDEYDVIKKLYENSLKNNINVSLIDVKSAKEFDKFIKTDAEKVLYVPNTAIVSPTKIYKHILDQMLLNTNIDTYFDSKVLNLLNKNEFIKDKNNFKDHFKLQTEKNGIFEAKYVINCSGPSCDKIANLFDHSLNYKNVPLKAVYHKYHLTAENMPNILVYPVPGPFSLGLHLTMENDNVLKFGPSVDIPILSLKDVDYDYRSFFWKNMELLKALTIFKNYKQIAVEFKNNSYYSGLRRLTKVYDRYQINELKKTERQVLIRTPAINVTTGLFEHDFIIEHSKNNIHLINFQSPAFTCFLPLSRHIIDIFEKF